MSLSPLSTLTRSLHVDTLNTYDGNNNVDDPSAQPSNMSEPSPSETRRARTTERDLAEARRRFPTPASGRVEEDEEGVRPIEGGDVRMEDWIRW